MIPRSGRLIVLWASLGVTAALVAAPPRLDPPRGGMLLLRNGEVLTGDIVRDGDHYIVSSHNGEIRIRATDVEATCRDLDEAYQRKLEGVRTGVVDEHLALAEWCLRHDLCGYAAEQVREALSADPEHPRIPLIERRLKLASVRPAARITARREASGPSNGDLDRLVRGLPPGTMEVFTRSIQPLLLNNCSASGCHGPNSHSALVLQRTPLSRHAGRRITQRNLYAVWQFVDTETPYESPLLTLPMQRHGTAKAPIFSDRKAEQYRQLAGWVRGIAQPAAERSTDLAEFGPLDVAVPGARGRGRALGQVRQAAANEFDNDPSAVRHAGYEPGTEEGTNDGADEPPFESDPLDDPHSAEHFHRRFGGE